MKKRTMYILAGLLLLMGIGVIAYPAVSNFINCQNGSYAIQALQEQLGQTEEEILQEQLRLAQAYNESLKTADPQEEASYYEILDFGNGMMGYIRIEKIDVTIPIYHGVSSEVLDKGVGHMPESAFPIGGEGNHAVLTGHTGLPSARIFTDLTELTEGDAFQVTIGGKTVTYQVDQIKVVLPEETEDLASVPGEDYCTLVTCTPYGINSHRLLVRGSRVQEEEQPVEGEPEQEEQENDWIPWGILAITLTVTAGVLIALLIHGRREDLHG